MPCPMPSLFFVCNTLESERPGWHAAEARGFLTSPALCGKPLTPLPNPPQEPRPRLVNRLLPQCRYLLSTGPARAPFWASVFGAEFYMGQKIFGKRKWTY